MIKSSLKTFFCLLVILTASYSFAQTKTFSPKGSFGLSLGVPAQPQNGVFERTMEGLLNAGLDFRYNVYNGLTVGAGLKYSLFALNAFAFNNIAISGGTQIPGAYVIVGYEKFTTERVSFTGSIRAGYSFIMSYNDSCRANLDKQHVSEAFYIEPQIEMVMLTDKVSEHGFSMVLGYNFYFHEYGLEDLCMSQVPNLTDENFEGITRFLSIGFGYRYYLGRN